MALPFILGLALGAGAVVAFTKSDKLQEQACKVVDKSKALACSSLEKSKELVNEVKNKIMTSKEELTSENETSDNTFLEEPKKRVRKVKAKEES
ncbi:MAG: hypothetical protein HRT41_00930 [Campylobacteraceae bacterium]|nr:hypothetical protein [Campylobacteraceae bacterium]